MVHATADGVGSQQRIRYGMVGGGRGAFIGAVHRFAARLDDLYTLVAGVLSSDGDNARLSGLDLGLAPGMGLPCLRAAQHRGARRQLQE